ncbi:MAG: hypothetical protein NC489_16630 [Ruminococcus flavefaciens]|nr:hypothetical protein [Ruminococcus flavefaciens]
MSEPTHKVVHQVSEGEPCDDVMTIALLKALLNSGTYPDEMIVMISADAITARQVTGFFTACSGETGNPYLVLTSRPDAQTEHFVRKYQPRNEEGVDHE